MIGKNKYLPSYQFKLKKRPLVTILMNCYNEEKFITRSIESALGQTYKNFELLIWDDASKDNTRKIVQSFNDKRIKLFKNSKHLGLGASRCKAQNKINGDLVAILDADDVMISDRIEKQVNEFIANKKLALVGSWIKFKNTKGEIIPKKFFEVSDEKIKENMVWRNIFSHSSIMYKKENAKKIGWYSNMLEYAQDYDLSIRLIKDHDCKILPEYLTFITTRKESMTSIKKFKKRRIQENLYILKKCKSQIKMNKRLFFLNSRSIKMNELKLKLTQNLNILKKFFYIIKTLIQFPSLIHLHFLK